jgi:hypothetical protein
MRDQFPEIAPEDAASIDSPEWEGSQQPLPDTLPDDPIEWEEDE